MAAPFTVSGLCAAPFTPFLPSGEVDVESIPLHVAELQRQGVPYAFVCGTTGEGVTMSVAERQRTLDAWLAAAGGTQLKIIAHVGAESIADMTALARHAKGESGGVPFRPGPLERASHSLQGRECAAVIAAATGSAVTPSLQISWGARRRAPLRRPRSGESR